MCKVWISNSGLSATDLIELLEKLTTPSDSYYFLRWAHRLGGFWQRRNDKFKSLEDDIRNHLDVHKVNGIKPKHSENFPSPEGQMFNPTLEVRWKQKQNKFQVLILGLSEEIKGFRDIKRDWEVIEQTAILHPPDETRFPKNFATDKVNIAQRYFRDRNTATVHFVALTVKSS